MRQASARLLSNAEFALHTLSQLVGTNRSNAPSASACCSCTPRRWMANYKIVYLTRLARGLTCRLTARAFQPQPEKARRSLPTSAPLALLAGPILSAPSLATFSPPEPFNCEATRG